jgi:hypothetical protein
MNGSDEFLVIGIQADLMGIFLDAGAVIAFF